MKFIDRHVSIHDRPEIKDKIRRKNSKDKAKEKRKKYIYIYFYFLEND